MTPTRVIGAALVAILVGLLAVPYVLAVRPSVKRERQQAVARACLGLQPTTNEVLGRLPKPAPDIRVLDWQGQAWNVPSAYRGKVVLLNFWATWCPPCREEMPSMEDLQRTFSTDDFVIVAVSSDDGWDQVRPFFPNGTNMTVFLDPTARDEGADLGELAKLYGTQRIPDTYLIDRQGNVRFYVMNARDWRHPKVLRCIDALIKE